MKSAVVAALQVASPRRTVTSGLLQRQCACGSRAGSSGKCEGCSKKRIVGLQTKMQVGHPSDAFEQEADRVADQVIATLADSAITSLPPRIQRFMGRLTRKTEDISASVDQVPASPGRPLDLALQRDMEQRFGHDFSKVRVHTGTQAERSARQVNAHAYTVGQAMIFGQGRYEPETNEGRRLIVHELAHVVQQSRGGPPPGLVHEADAERAEAQMVRGAECIQVVEASRVGVARQPEEIALEDAWEELQKVRKDLDNYVISLDAKAKLNTKRQHLERLLYGETKEQSQVRLLRNIGILPGGKIKEPTPISLLTREELAALPAKRFFVEQADREKVLRSKPISDGGRVTKALAEMGQMYQRPFTNFEVKLKSDKEVNITEEGVDGVKQFAVPSESVQPIYSYDKKKVVAYRAGYRLLDANGQTQQAVEHGIEPAVGPLDLVELLVPFGVPVAKVAIREAGLLGRALLRETAEQAPRQLRRLGRTLVAATIALEESGAAPRMASTLGSRGPRALIVKQIDEAAEALPKQIGKQVGKATTSAAKKAVKDTGKKVAKVLDVTAEAVPVPKKAATAVADAPAALPTKVSSEASKPIAASAGKKASGTSAAAAQAPAASDPMRLNKAQRHRWVDENHPGAKDTSWTRNQSVVAMNERGVLVIQPEPGMLLNDARRKAAALADLAERGKLSTLRIGEKAATRTRVAPRFGDVSTPVSLSTRYRHDLIEVVHKRATAENWTKARKQALIERLVRRTEGDHVAELQLNGIDDVASNIWALDAYTNERLGGQISRQLANIPPGTRITEVRFGLSQALEAEQIVTKAAAGLAGKSRDRIIKIVDGEIVEFSAEEWARRSPRFKLVDGELVEVSEQEFINYAVGELLGDLKQEVLEQAVAPVKAVK